MCERYVLVETLEAIEKRFLVKVDPEQYKVNYNLSVGQRAPVIISAAKNSVQFFQFGLTPFWAHTPMYLFNARSEGDENKDDDPNYSGIKRITEKASFRKPISSQRCLVLASGFIEGPDNVGLNKPFLVHLRDYKPFAMAGIYDVWKDYLKGDVVKSFAIITTTANDLLQRIGNHRMPVILNPGDEQTWLNTDIPLSGITDLLKQYPAELMNAYPVSPHIENYKINNKELLKPIGTSIYPEYASIEEMKLKSENRDSNNTLNWDERLAHLED